MFGYYGESLVGTPYVSGGAYESDGFDEAGFVSYCYMQMGLAIPLDCEQIRQETGAEISRDEMVIGDIVCYESGLVAIYVGDEKVVYASEAEGCVCYGDLDMENIAAIKQVVSYSDSIVGVG